MDEAYNQPLNLEQLKKKVRGKSLQRKTSDDAGIEAKTATAVSKVVRGLDSVLIDLVADKKEVVLPKLVEMRESLLQAYYGLTIKGHYGKKNVREDVEWDKDDEIDMSNYIHGLGLVDNCFVCAYVVVKDSHACEHCGKVIHKKCYERMRAHSRKCQCGEGVVPQAPGAEVANGN